MKLVKFGPHQAFLMADGAQVLFDRQNPVILRTAHGTWYRRTDVTPCVDTYINDYLKKAGVGVANAIPAAGDAFLRVVEAL